MKYSRLTTIAVVATSALTVAACGQNGRQVAPTNAAAEASGSASHGTAPPQQEEVRGVGVVMVVDNQAGTITLAHDAIPKANWPAMTMAFEAPLDARQRVTVGDNVRFSLRLTGGSGEIVSIDKKQETEQQRRQHHNQRSET